MICLGSNPDKIEKKEKKEKFGGNIAKLHEGRLPPSKYISVFLFRHFKPTSKV
jgi:hypothetical protein